MRPRLVRARPFGALIGLLALLSGPALDGGATRAADAAAAPMPRFEGGAALAPLAFLAGGCWTGAFPDGRATDEHCFEWVYGGWYLRDRHVVRGAGAPYEGETLYWWDAGANRIEFSYVNSIGDVTHGWVERAGETLVFHERLAGPAGERTLLTHWRRTTEDRYTVRTLEARGDSTRPLWSMEMARTGAAPDADASSAAPPPAVPDTALAGWRIAYNVLDPQTGNYEVFVMDPDGSNRRNLTRHPALDWVYAAAGDRLYFVSRRDTTERGFQLYEMDADGGNVRRLGRIRLRDSYVGVRSRGRELVVSALRDGNAELLLLDGAGRERRRLTRDPRVDTDPACSPDGRWIAFRRGEPFHGEIWIMAADGSDARQLTRYPEGLERPNQHLYPAGPPRWSPDGRWITFASHQRGNYDLWAIRPDGTGLRRLARTPADECWHDWSPDGRWIVTDFFDGVSHDIVLLDAEGRAVRRLTSGGPSEQSPVFVRAPGRP